MGLNERNKIQVAMYGSLDYTAGSDCVSSTEPSEGSRPSEASLAVPPIIPCYNGKTLKIHEELVNNGLSAISIKHHKGNCKEDRRSSPDPEAKKKDSKEESENENLSKKSDTSYKNFPRTNGDLPDCLKDKMKRRNSFWSLHRPELSKLTWPKNFISSAVLQDFFHNHLKIHGNFCDPLHIFSNRSSMMDEEIRDYSRLRYADSNLEGEFEEFIGRIHGFREIVPPRILPPDEKVVVIREKSRSVQLNDEDLDPETTVHKSRAEFCVTIGEYIRRPPLKRSTSQQTPKCVYQQTNRFESLPLQHEGLLSKEAMISEERVSAVIGSTDLYMNSTKSPKSSKKLSAGNISGKVLRRASLADSQRLVSTSPPSLNNFHQPYNDQVTEDSGDPARLRTILSPRDEATEESASSHYRG